MAGVTTSCNPHPIDISPESGRNGVSIVPGSPEDTARKTAAALCQSQVDTKYDVPTQDIYSGKKKEGFSNDRQNYSIYIILLFVTCLFILLVSRRNILYKAKIYMLISILILMSVVIYLYTRNGSK
jgi:hypothetical protein